MYDLTEHLIDQHEMQVGILAPEPHPTGALLTGQVGYLITGA